MAKKSVVDDFNLSDECRQCKRVLRNGGNCAGKALGAVPCLVFLSNKARGDRKDA